MKKLLLLFTLLLTIGAWSQTLTVNNGYGSGTYNVGDTVHIWSTAIDTTETFDKWTGDTQFLLRDKEWHSLLVMPNEDVTITAEVIPMPAHTIQHEQIMGANELKNVYSSFPSFAKGVLYLFHGTGGNAGNWISNVEYRSFVNAAIADSFGVIITEAEEITLNTDLNGDGKLRWNGYPLDSINEVDYVNLRAIRDTFINRGIFDASWPVYTAGMSNGGGFSALYSELFQCDAGISYCAHSSTLLFELRNVPFGFRMARYDDHENVGAEGNYTAFQCDSILEERSICNSYVNLDKQPIYPERFARVPGLSVGASQSIYNDMSSNGMLLPGSYAQHSQVVLDHVTNNPLAWPSLFALSNAQRAQVLLQISAANTEHRFYSDLNDATLSFLRYPCQEIAQISSNEIVKNVVHVYPNPAQSEIYIESNLSQYQVEIRSVEGKLVLQKLNHVGTTILNINSLTEGVYLIIVTNNKESHCSKLVKK